MIPALVLTAGLGTRLSPITDYVAKPAVPLGDVTLGERVLQWLAGEGVTDAVLNLHHLPHTVTAAIGDGAHLDIRVRYSLEPQLLGSAGGPRHALPLLFSTAGGASGSEPFLIVNGDTLTDVRLAPVIEAHRRTGAEVTLVVIRNPAPDRYNGVVAGGDHVVRGFRPKGHREPTWHFVGIQVANSSVFAPLPDGAPVETVSGIYRDMVEARPGAVMVCPVDARFLDVGTPADYLATCEALHVSPPQWILDRLNRNG